MISVVPKLRMKNRKDDDGVVSRIFGVHRPGADELIKDISSHKVVRKLHVDRFRLPDNGWTKVFQYLRTLPTSRSEITEIDLRGCLMDDNDLLAISGFLTNDTKLKTLWLQNNRFEFATEVVDVFIVALNSSHLKTLRLSSNPNRNHFVPRLLRGLDTRYLKTLELSSMGLDTECARHLSDYFASPRCHLCTIRMNGNEFSAEDVETIYRGLQFNYTITVVQTHCVNVGNAEHQEIIRRHLSMRERIQTRNKLLHIKAAKDALHLLRHSRAALLPSSTSPHPPTPKPLPTELILHILSFLAPSLSSNQRIRIFQYASNRSTLPPLLPRLPVQKCLPDPGAPPGPNGGCSENCCMGSAHYLSCRRESEREEWLREMHCDSYEPPEANLDPGVTNEQSSEPLPLPGLPS